MTRRLPVSTGTDTLFPYTPLFLSRIGFGIAEALLERLVLVEIEIARERGIAVALDLGGEAVVLVLTIADQAGQFFVETDPKHALAVRIEGHIIADRKSTRLNSSH